jgi:hypothetical protein
MELKKKFYNIARELYLNKIILSLYGIPCDIKLKIINKNKFIFFDKLSKKYSSILNIFLLNKNDVSSFVTPFWTKEFETIKDELISNININFLRNEILARTISVHGNPIIIDPELKSYLKYIQQYDNKGISNLLTEDYVGKPYIVSLMSCSSFIRIQHIYHLVRYFNETNKNPSNISSIIEWGGGYGDMATILARLNSNITYIIIDHAYMSALQYLYISSVLESTDRLNIVQYEDVPKKGYINFISLNNLNLNQNLSTEMFISTFALTESSEFALKLVLNRNFFNAENILIAYQSENKDVPYGQKYSKIILDRYQLKKIPISSYRNYDYYLLK